MQDIVMVEGITAFVDRANNLEPGEASVATGLAHGPCGCGKPDCKGLGVAVVLVIRDDAGSALCASLSASQAFKVSELLGRAGMRAAAEMEAIPDRPERLN